MKKDKLKNNPVNKPRHYTNHPSGIEAIEVCGEMEFCLGNAFKYCFRMDNKGKPLEDLRKARWYVKRKMFKICCSEDLRGNPDTIWKEDWGWLLEFDCDLNSHWQERYIPNSFNQARLLYKIIDENPDGNVERAIFYIWLANDDGAPYTALRLALHYINKEIRKRTRAINKQKKEKT